MLIELTYRDSNLQYKAFAAQFSQLVMSFYCLTSVLRVKYEQKFIFPILHYLRN